MTVNLAESPLAWLHARGHLSDRLHDAGEALRADYERAQLPASITMRWDPVRVKSTGERGLAPSEKQIAARRRFPLESLKDPMVLFHHLEQCGLGLR